MLRVAPALLLACALTAGCQASAVEKDVPPDATPPPPTPLRMLVAGDSISQGYYATTVEQGFADRLVNQMQVHDVTRVDATIAGARAWRIADLVEEVLADEAPVDLVVLEVGANDVGKTSLTDWRSAYARLLGAVTADSPDAEVVCLGPWNEPAASASYEAVVESLCADLVYVPLSDLYAVERYRGPAGARTELGTRDSFHPNDQGHRQIARRVARAAS